MATRWARGLATAAVHEGSPSRWSFEAGMIDVERIDTNLFRTANVAALWRPPMGQGVYGGQVIGQALAAAHETVDDDWARKASRASERGDAVVNSAHAYFLRPGNSKKPMVFRVERLLDGGSFSVRSVVAVQEGTPIFSIQASFHRREQFPGTYQLDMSAVPGPESVRSHSQLLKEALADPRCPERVRTLVNASYSKPFPFDMRPIDVVDLGLLGRPAPTPPRNRIWLKARTPIHGNADLHRCLAAWVSDWTISAVALLPLGLRPYSPELSMICSLDHTIYFHDDVRMDDWVLYEMASNFLGGGRGLTHGRMYDASGKLKISVSQEALYRIRAEQGAADYRL